MRHELHEAGEPMIGTTPPNTNRKGFTQRAQRTQRFGRRLFWVRRRRLQAKAVASKTFTVRASASVFAQLRRDRALKRPPSPDASRAVACRQIVMQRVHDGKAASTFAKAMVDREGCRTPRRWRVRQVPGDRHAGGRPRSVAGAASKGFALLYRAGRQTLS
jgi:hypothetical protein